MSGWPNAQLDAVARLHVLAASKPWLAYCERHIDAPFDDVWAIAGDLEGHGHDYELGIRSVEIVARCGDRLEVRARGIFDIPSRFDALLRPGWCLMQNRLGLIGMAASPAADGRGTRFAHFEGSPLLGRALRPVFARKIAHEVDAIARLATELAGP